MLQTATVDATDQDSVAEFFASVERRTDHLVLSFSTGRVGGRVMGDKAYSSAANRSYLRRRGIQAVIPVKEDQKKHRRARGQAGGRPPAFDPGLYTERNTFERCFSKLKQFRAVATRYDKRDYMYQATVDVASIRIWLRDHVT